MTKEELKSSLESFFVSKYGLPKNQHLPLNFDLMLSSVISQAIAEHEASKTVIKAKALRKKGTDKWYQIDYVALDDGNFPFRTRRLPDLWHDEYRKDGIGFVAESNLPSDAELIDIEIIVKAGGER